MRCGEMSLVRGGEGRGGKVGLGELRGGEGTEMRQGPFR